MNERHGDVPDGDEIIGIGRGPRALERRLAELERENRELRRRLNEAAAPGPGSETVVAAIARTALDSMFIKDCQLRYTFVNQAMERTLGRPAAELLGKTAEEVFDAATAAVIAEVDGPALAGRAVDEVRQLELGGRTYAFHTVQVPLVAEDGSVTGICGVVRDVTAQKRAERERLELQRKMQQTQKLESLGVLAGGIAHDFNNLLVGMLGNADLLRLELEPGSAGRGQAEDIVQAARRASELVRQLLAYAGVGRVARRPIDLRRLVEEMGRLLQASISKKARLQLGFDEDLPAIQGDAAELRQVVMNLIINASEALGDESGTIRVRLGAADCDHRRLAASWLDDGLEPGRYAFVEVGDSGSGMDAETVGRIFDPFFSTKFTGRGLGLAAVLGIVRAHHGALEVETSPGAGATFRVLLPAAAAAKAEPAAAAEPVAWRGHGTVLLVDDEPIVREVAAVMLERLGFAVLAAADGAEAIERVRAEPQRFSAVLLDLAMPRMGGEECFTALHRLRPDLPVLLSSGYSQPELSQRFADRGLAGFIQKPYRYEDLATAMRAALGEPSRDPT